MLFSKQFMKELTLQVKMLELHVIFKSCETDDVKTANNVKIINDDLVNISEKLCLKYRNFFNVNKAEQQSSHQLTDHVIELKSNSELLYM